MKKIKFNVGVGGISINNRKIIDELGVLSSYPIGSIYMNINEVSPSELFGGSWVKIEDKFLLASGKSYSLASEGGESSHVLTVNEMPSHNHGVKYELTSATRSNWAAHLGDGAAGIFSDHVTYTGGNGAHNNMPPYIVVNVWKRVS